MDREREREREREKERGREGGGLQKKLRKEKEGMRGKYEGRER